MWNGVRKKLPNLINDKRDEMLCMTRKFGHNGTNHNYPYGMGMKYFGGMEKMGRLGYKGF